MNCPKCNTKMVVEVKLSGGCGGHWGEDARCYCDDPDVRLLWFCPNSNFKEVTTIGKNGRTTITFKNGSCQFKERVFVRGLTDQYSIARWFNEHKELLE